MVEIFKHSKSDVLQLLRNKVKSAIILDQVSFTVKDWRSNSQSVIEKIHDLGLINKKLIIRSSALGEDGHKSSYAGHFISVLNICGVQEILSAVLKVINSFPDDHPDNQVFIQEMILDVKMSGVVFTRDPNNNSPYIVINYDEKSGRTDTVTSGSTNDLKTFYFHKLYRKNFGDFRNRIFQLIDELEEITECKALDIEFAFDKEENFYLFQVRPLVIVDDKYDITDENHYTILQGINMRLESWMKAHPYLCGDKGIYGVMPDWNPAEIIGIKPNPLAISLYREVVTNSIWAYQRDNYGYRNLRSFPLLLEFEGMPYIDIRVSFNSFVPASLDEKIANKLVNYYLRKLTNNPAFHDKVEFEIVFSCFTFDLDEKLGSLEKEGFSGDEVNKIKESLLNLTNNIISDPSGLWKEDLKKIEILKEHHHKIMHGDLDDYSKMYWLIEDCKRYGTLPFAGLARAGFIAVEILKSMVKKSMITQENYQDFLSSLNTVSSEISKDFVHESKEKFLEKYGHLRPGTYDILSKRYDEDPDNYFNWNRIVKEKVEKKNSFFKLSNEQRDNIAASIEKSGLQINIQQIFEFIKEAIEAREYSKFIFTKNLSDFLKIYSKVCAELNISLDEASYTHVQSILSLNSISSDPRKIITASINRRKKRFEITKYINLPPLITDANDVFCFYEFDSQPNYITQKKVSAEIKITKNNDNDISGKIVFIPSADPGYDWIFSHDIKALVTKYGGVNSHMAIRACEMGIPAIIGSGKYYDIWASAKKLEIDCLNKKVVMI